MIATAETPKRRAPRLQRGPRALVLRAPGVNCDRETAHALELAGARPERVHIEALWSGARTLDEFALLALPGGFSYGDHLGAGTLWGRRLMALRDRLDRFVSSDRPVLGICNGFQALLKLGLLEGGALGPNASGRFTCRWVWLERPTNVVSPLLAGIERLAVPVANGEGRFVAESAATLERLKREGQVALVYVAAEDGATDIPVDPSGSDGAVAALLNARGNVLGMMPHPERNATSGQAPAGRPEGDGLAIFRNAVAMARG